MDFSGRRPFPRLGKTIDSAYTQIDLIHLGIGAAHEYRAQARKAAKNPEVTAKYKTVIRPYWKQFGVRMPKKFWFDLYANARTGFSEKYIPDDLWYRYILPHYNHVPAAYALQDKCALSEMFPDIRHPVTPVRNMSGAFFDEAKNRITAEEAAQLCLHRGRILIKPSVGSGQGHGIRFFDSDALTAADVLKLFADYGQNFLVQEKLRQHDDLAALNPDSLNTLRIKTFLYDNRVRVLSSIVRVGRRHAELDNISQGGFGIPILEDGRLGGTGVTYANGRMIYVDAFDDGRKFTDYGIPSYGRVIESVKALAAKTGYFRIIGWDLSVAADGEPVLIEYNVLPGGDQDICGPTFGDLTDNVLAEVFGRR